MKRSDLRRIVAEQLNIEPDSLSETTSLKSIEDFDSFSILVLMMTLDEEAGVKLTPQQVESLKTYGDIETIAVEQGVHLTED